MTSQGPSARHPDVFIVGAPKCGTTSLCNYLSEHPQVYVSPKKEPLHFCSDRHREIWREPDRERYLALFDGARPGQRRVEGSTWYLFSPGAAARIKAFAPDARIIIMLRNPVDMVLSLHAQFLFSTNENIRDFHEAYSAQDARRRGERVPPWAHFPPGLQYTQVARFAPQVRRMMDTFGRDAIKVVLLEEFSADKERVYNDILSFIGVDAASVPDFKVHNQRRQVRSLWLQRHLTKSFRLWKPSSALPFLPGLRALDWRMEGVRRKLLKRNQEPAAPPRLSTEDRRALHADFAEDIDALETLLGRSLDLWRTRNLGPRPASSHTPAGRAPVTA